MDSAKFIQDFISHSRRTLDDMPTERISAAADLIFSTWKAGGCVFIAGNGGSASTATHMACDLAKMTIVGDMPRLRAIGLNDNIPLVSALTNDDGWENIYTEQLKNWKIGPSDLLIAISVHGGSGQDKAGAWSQNLTNAISYASEHGAKTIGLAGFDGGAMKSLCTVAVVVPTDSTPQVESFHVWVEHLLSVLVRDRIAEEAKASGKGVGSLRV